MPDNGFNAAQLAIVAASLTVLADIVALIAAIKAYNEEQASLNNNKQKIQDIMKYLQEKLDP